MKEANAFVIEHHRHHNKVVGAILSIGAFEDDVLVGVAILGRPVGRRFNYREVCEVTRLCSDGTENACSKLYGAARRIAKELGFKTIQTYILQSEDGTSLRAAGWKLVAENVGGEKWNGRSHETHTLFGSEEKRPQEKKKRWEQEIKQDSNSNGKVGLI